MGLEVLPLDINESLSIWRSKAAKSGFDRQPSKEFHESPLLQIIAIRDEGGGKFASPKILRCVCRVKISTRNFGIAQNPVRWICSVNAPYFVGQYQRIAEFSKSAGDSAASRGSLNAPYRIRCVENPFDPVTPATAQQKLLWEKRRPASTFPAIRSPDFASTSGKGTTHQYSSHPKTVTSARHACRYYRKRETHPHQERRHDGDYQY